MDEAKDLHGKYVFLKFCRKGRDRYVPKKKAIKKKEEQFNKRCERARSEKRKTVNAKRKTAAPIAVVRTGIRKYKNIFFL